MCPTFVVTQVLQTDVQWPYCSYVCLKWEIKYEYKAPLWRCIDQVYRNTKFTKRNETIIEAWNSQVGLGTFLSILSWDEKSKRIFFWIQKGKVFIQEDPKLLDILKNVGGKENFLFYMRFIYILFFDGRRNLKVQH